MNSLLEHPAINNAIITEDTLYLIVNNKPPTVYTDKKIITIKQEELLTHPELLTILTHGKKPTLQEHTIYTYNNKKATKTQKQSLAHIINGTGGRNSIITRNGGRNLGKGSFLIPPHNEKLIDETLTKHDATFDKTTIYTKT